MHVLCSERLPLAPRVRPRHRISGVQNSERRAPPEHSGQKNKYMILTDGQLSLSLQPRGSGYYFIP